MVRPGSASARRYRPGRREEADDPEREVREIEVLRFGMEPTAEELRAFLMRIRQDLRDAARNLGPREARYLVDSYYQIQNYRIRSDAQAKRQLEAKEPFVLTKWLGNTLSYTEKFIAAVLDEWGKGQPGAVWARQIVGIGPVISAGLAAHIDVTRQPTVGKLWRFAGLDPTSVWHPGKKRPWNARLKVLCWKLGESFWITHNNPRSYYGPLMARRKELEIWRNEQGMYREQAERRAGQVGRDTQAYQWYSQGKLPPGHIHARARRWVVKLFLAHYWEHERRRLGLEVPLPYPIAYLGHPKEDLIPPPL
jgi:hypothetical protein